MGDILFPSPAYMEDEFIYDEHNDVEWSKKSNNVYWAGSSTGGLASDERWKQYQRQRFVALAQNLQKPEQQKHIYLRQVNGVIERVASSFLNSRLYDVAFTRIFQCERTQCRDQKSYFNVRSWVDKNEALRSRLVFDLDGNGISGRYYKLLASKSTPLKQTLLREWHDDRLVPWVHYVPVSLGMGELPELVTYLTTTEPGQRRAREIAEQGKDWYSNAFREVDLAIYTYRLLLELARLQDPNRQAR
ncbi:beta-1,2-xylosyltransferase 1 [Colletotrichum liriopes]|uniref:Beta-1,2-xylosyltransferase 1 n=1 Tax=Colletotrichum liriopes TaxID=708192 RepID=A0AA37LWZ4_9PEZI|nr:beta-1,2-xylosyltransferase 1 [Colletotrichum liriopes]